MNRRYVRMAIRVLAIGAVVAALWWFVRAMDFRALGTALTHAKVWPLILAAALNFVCLYGKAAVWRIMLAPRFIVKTSRLFRYTVTAFAASAIAPARAGEVLRVWVLKKRDGVPAADTAAVAVAEKLLDGVSMLLLVAPVPLLLPDLPGWVGTSILICAGVAVVLLGVLVYLAGRPLPEGAAPSVARRFFAGMHVLRSPKRLFGAIGLLLLVWAADLGEVMAVLYAVDIHLPIAAGLLILFTLNLTIMVPSTPAQVGALEVGALAALDLMHVPHESALAFALLYHLLQVIPLIIAGLSLELNLVLGRRGSEPSASATE